jgi:hypothetical protein
VSKSAVCTSPAFVGFIALTGIILSGSPTRAGEECLAAPNSSAPPGSHWFYHLDRSTQRKCWYVRTEDQQAHAESTKNQPAATSSAVATGERTSVSRQTERAQTHPAAISDQIEAEASVSDKPEPTEIAAPAISATDEQPTSSDKPELPPTPSPPVVSGPELSASVVEKSGAASAALNVSAVQDQATVAHSATFTPMRVLLLIPAALALIGVLAFAVVPARFRRLVYAGRRGSIAEPIRSTPQIGMPDELKRNLRQVLQTLEAQLRGDLELEEAPAQRQSPSLDCFASLAMTDGSDSSLRGEKRRSNPADLRVA